MKKGSNILLVMMGVYLIVAVVVVIILIPKGGTRSDAKEPEGIEEMREARVMGDASSDRPVDPGWVNSDGVVSLNEAERAALATPTPTPTPVEEPKKQYYGFSLNNVSSWLNVRKEPKKSSAILGQLKPGSTGYILEQDEEWSLIISEDGKTKGYCFNEYLSVREVEEEDFPEEYRD